MLVILLYRAALRQLFIFTGGLGDHLSLNLAVGAARCFAIVKALMHQRSGAGINEPANANANDLSFSRGW